MEHTLDDNGWVKHDKTCVSAMDYMSGIPDDMSQNSIKPCSDMASWEIKKDTVFDYVDKGEVPDFEPLLERKTTTIEMLEGRVAPYLEKHLKAAKTSNRMLRSLIEDILDLTRLEEGQFDLNMEHFRIGVLSDLLDELFRYQLERKGL